MRQQQTAQKHPAAKLWNLLFSSVSDRNIFHLALFDCQSGYETCLFCDFIDSKT